MKMNIKKAVSLTAVAILISGSVYAMGPRPCGQPPIGPPPVEQLQEQLDLSDSQAEALSTLFIEQRNRHRALRREHRAEREQMKQKLSAILTPTQLDDFETQGSCNRKHGKHFGGRGVGRGF
ncbi:MAG: periplasmic heavy metal sensor [Gammaproteobacteria bacterium]|jgi:Spy/CpxP family protein refolding chaperone|nr:periplasmic heavy metal sensor [Gammaproteobacteria bacterium]